MIYVERKLVFEMKEDLAYINSLEKKIDRFQNLKSKYFAMIKERDLEITSLKTFENDKE